jgi:hypothetical protein
LPHFGPLDSMGHASATAPYSEFSLTGRPAMR